ncbi:MAG: hypothetical protein ABSG64_00040 [Solirubrobacteraceae bacterium]
MSAAPFSRRDRRRPSPALAIAMLALVLALGGTGYAATQTAGGVKLVYEYIAGSLAPHAGGYWDAVCPSGTRPVGGGFNTESDKNVIVTDSAPFSQAIRRIAGGSTQNPDSWTATFYNTGTASATVQTIVVCAPD